MYLWDLYPTDVMQLETILVKSELGFNDDVSLEIVA